MVIRSRRFFVTKIVQIQIAYSVFFRVEEVFGNCCATLRVLEPRSRANEEVDLLDSTTHTTLDLRKYL